MTRYSPVGACKADCVGNRFGKNAPCLIDLKRGTIGRRLLVGGDFPGSPRDTTEDRQRRQSQEDSNKDYLFGPYDGHL